MWEKDLPYPFGITVCKNDRGFIDFPECPRIVLMSKRSSCFVSYVKIVVVQRSVVLLFTSYLSLLVDRVYLMSLCAMRSPLHRWIWRS